MKRISLLLSVLILFCGSMIAQDDKVSFNERIHDFGVIVDKDGVVNFDFFLTNNSADPLKITNVTTSCGCTSPMWTREPIEPKNSGKITVSYNPANQRGQFSKSVSISLSDGSRHGLSIRGEVIKSEDVVKKLTPEQEYPHAFGNYRIKTEELSFGQVDFNEKKTIILEVFNNSDSPITQKTIKLPKYIKVDFIPAVIPPKTAANIEAILEVQDYSLWGDLSNEITIQVNGANKTIPYSVNVVEDFSKWTASKKADAGKINVSTREIDFGNLRSGSAKTLKISNSGKSVLNVHTIKPSDPSITVSKSNFAIKPGEISEIKINIDSKKVQSGLSSTLIIVTNDPTKPLFEVAIKANNKL